MANRHPGTHRFQPTPETIAAGEQLEARLQRHGLSKAKLAELADVHRSTVYAWCDGRVARIPRLVLAYLDKQEAVTAIRDAAASAAQHPVTKSPGKQERIAT